MNITKNKPNKQAEKDYKIKNYCNNSNSLPVQQDNNIVNDKLLLTKNHSYCRDCRRLTQTLNIILHSGHIANCCCICKDPRTNKEYCNIKAKLWHTNHHKQTNNSKLGA